MGTNSYAWAVYGIFFTTMGVAAALVIQGGQWFGSLTEKEAGIWAIVTGLLFFVVAGGTALAYLITTQRLNTRSARSAAATPTPATENTTGNPTTPPVPANIAIETHADRTVTITISLP